MPPPLGNTAIRRPSLAALAQPRVKAVNAGLHGAGLFALLTLARLGIAAGAPGSAAWASAATTTALHSE